MILQWSRTHGWSMRGAMPPPAAACCSSGRSTGCAKHRGAGFVLPPQCMELGLLDRRFVDWLVHGA
jgi:hypothetical protein